MFWRKNNSITKHSTTPDLTNNGLSRIMKNRCTSAYFDSIENEIQKVFDVYHCDKNAYRLFYSFVPSQSNQFHRMFCRDYFVLLFLHSILPEARQLLS